jgi:hypothetical protein
MDRLFAEQHMTASILLVAGFVLVGTERAILSVGNDCDLLRIHAEVHQNASGCLGPFFTKDKIVIVAAAFVTMTGNLQQRVGIVL